MNYAYGAFSRDGPVFVEGGCTSSVQVREKFLYHKLQLICKLALSPGSSAGEEEKKRGTLEVDT